MGAAGTGLGCPAGPGAEAVSLRGDIRALLERTGPLTARNVCMLMTSYPRDLVMATVGQMHRDNLLHVVGWENHLAGVVMRWQRVLALGPRVGEDPAKPAPMTGYAKNKAYRIRQRPPLPVVNSVFAYRP